MAGFYALSMLYSCSDEDYEAGVSLHPPSELISVHFDSTQTVEAYSYEMENNFIVSYDMSYLLLGYSNDPILGETENAFATHIEYYSSVFVHPTTLIKDSVYVQDSDTSYWSQVNTVHENHIIIDSVYLLLEFGSSTGIPYTDSIGIDQEIEIYELLHDVNLYSLNGKESNSNSFDDKIKPEILAKATFTPYSIWNIDNNEKTLRIDLPLELGKRLLQDTIFEGSDTILPYQDESYFNEHILNGLYVKPKNDVNTRTTISSIIAASTSVGVKYRHFNITGGDSVIVDTAVFTVSATNTYKTNHFQNHYSAGVVTNPISTDVGEAKSDDYVYLKNNGLFARIVIDDIGNWADSTNISINKASIKLDFIEPFDTNTVFSPIPTLIVFQEIGNTLAYMQDHFDGNSSLVNRTEDGYEIILTTEMQKMIKNNEKSITILFQSASNNSSAYRSVMLQPKHINITYSKY